MRFQVCAVLAGLVSAVWIQGAAAGPADEAPLAVQRLPHVMVTPDELANPALYHPRPDLEPYSPPPIFPAPPPDGSIRPGEFDPMDSVIIAPMNYGADFITMFREMVVSYAAGGHVWIIIDDTLKETFDPMLVEAGVPAGSYSYLNYPVDTIWIRDYGPEFVVDPTGLRHIWDANYGSTRPLDDAIPLRMAASDWINSDGEPMDVMTTTEHGLSGGNITTDGAGTCFFSKIVYGYEKPAGWTDEDVNEEMQTYLGCEQIVTLQSICLDATGHIDLYAKNMGATSILLGEYPADTHFIGVEASGVSSGFCTDPQHPNDYQDMEDNLATLEATQNLAGDPWVITRLPMPEPYFDGAYWVVRSYMNSQIINEQVAMPSFYDEQDDEWTETADELLDLEAAAIAAYETARPGVVVTPIDADAIIPLAGAMHCITHEIPMEAGDAWVAPEEYCGDGIINGDEECDGENIGDQDCEDFGNGPGDYLSCTPSCTVDDSECPSLNCGDGVVDDNEECDPCAETQPDCAEWELGAGQIGSNLDCTFNLVDCPEASLCDAVAAVVPGMVCCPDSPPEDCTAGSWEFSEHDSYYGCCTADLTETIWCDGSTFVQYGCASYGGPCQFVGSYVDCAAGDMPEGAEPADCADAGADSDTDSDTDTDADTDTAADAGTGGGDDGCGCSAAGATGFTGLLALILG